MAAEARARTLEPMYAAVRLILVVFLRTFFRWRFIGLDQLPRAGGTIVAANHISYFDPLCHALFINTAGRRMRFFAKSELWENAFLRWVLSRTKMIPVERGSGETGPIERSVEALERGDVVVIYPEATITRNDDLTPMQGKTGAARVALATGVPIVPVAVWGSHWVKPKRRMAVHRWRRLIVMKAGDPLRFPEYAGRQDDPEARRHVTELVMKELDRLVRDLHAVYPEGAAVPPLREAKG